MSNVFFIFLFLFYSKAIAFGNETDVSSILFHEVANGNTMDIFPFVPSIHFPPLITAHFVMLLIAAILILTLLFYAKRTMSLKPKGFQTAIESVILFVQDDIVFPVMGEARGRKWLPFFSTLFIFLFTVNLLGLIPAFKTATGNINVTTSLSVLILCLIFIVGLKNIGFKKFFVNFYPKGIAFPIGIFVASLEFAGIFIKSIVLSLRLFANMFAGHLAIFSFLMLIFVMNPFMGIFAVPCAVFTYLLEIIIGLIQALVFTLLSCIFITMSSSAHE